MNCRFSLDIQPVLDMVRTARAHPERATPLIRRALNIDGAYDWQLSEDSTMVQKTQPNRRVGVTPGDGGSRLRLAYVSSIATKFPVTLLPTMSPPACLLLKFWRRREK